MDEQRIKGKLDEVAGTAKQKIGHATGNTRLEVEGVVQHIKGKVESAVGEVKDGVRDANTEARGTEEDQRNRYVKD